MSKKIKERVAGKQIADVMIELSAKILQLEETLSGEIWSRKVDEDKIKKLEEETKRMIEQSNKSNIQAAQANIAEGKARTALKELESKYTAVVDERLTLRGKVVDLQAEAVANSEKYLKVDQESRRMYQIANKLEGQLSIAKNEIGLWEKESAQWKNAHEHVHGLYVTEMKLKEKARRELRKFKKSIDA